MAVTISLSRDRDTFQIIEWRKEFVSTGACPYPFHRPHSKLLVLQHPMKIWIIIQDQIPTPHVFNRSFRVTQSADTYSYSAAMGIAFVWEMKNWKDSTIWIGELLALIFGIFWFVWNTQILQTQCFWTLSIVLFIFQITTFQRLDSVFVFR
jgi:hypothetical protein